MTKLSKNTNPHNINNPTAVANPNDENKFHIVEEELTGIKDDKLEEVFFLTAKEIRWEALRVKDSEQALLAVTWLFTRSAGNLSHFQKSPSRIPHSRIPHSRPIARNAHCFWLAPKIQKTVCLNTFGPLCCLSLCGSLISSIQMPCPNSLAGRPDKKQNCC
jgi:hypothetical protein